MLPTGLERNEVELSVMRGIAESTNDGPVLMLNLSRYTPAAGFPNGDLYQRYICGLETFLRTAGAQILWRLPVLGQAVGDQKINEVLAAWYPTHRAFLHLPTMSGAEENYRLRGLCVEHAVIHRCPGALPSTNRADDPGVPLTSCGSGRGGAEVLGPRNDHGST